MQCFIGLNDPPVLVALLHAALLSVVLSLQPFLLSVPHSFCWVFSLPVSSVLCLFLLQRSQYLLVGLAVFLVVCYAVLDILLQASFFACLSELVYSPHLFPALLPAYMLACLADRMPACLMTLFGCLHHFPIFLPLDLFPPCKLTPASFLFYRPAYLQHSFPGI